MKEPSTEQHIIYQIRRIHNDRCGSKDTIPDVFWLTRDKKKIKEVITAIKEADLDTLQASGFAYCECDRYNVEKANISELKELSEQNPLFLDYCYPSSIYNESDHKLLGFEEMPADAYLGMILSCTSMWRQLLPESITELEDPKADRAINQIVHSENNMDDLIENYETYKRNNPDQPSYHRGELV